MQTKFFVLKNCYIHGDGMFRHVRMHNAEWSDVPFLVEGLLHHSIPHWGMWLVYAVSGYLPLWRLARRVRISAFFLAAPEPC